MGKIVETRNLYKETINSITKTEENWLKFLDSVSWHFKYDFVDQVLIYAQRPEAKACAELEVWNNKVHRWINKDAKFIFVLSKDENSEYPFRMVFDVADTHNYKGTEYKLWSIKPEYEKKIIETLETTFGGECKSDKLSEHIIANAYTMVEDNIQDYLSTIYENKQESDLNNLSNEEIRNITFLTVWASVSYMILTRCGINAREKISKDEFALIKNFNNSKIITALGTMISDISEMGLREIAKTVKNLQIEEKNLNRTFANNNNKEYSNNKEIDKGGTENGENRIQTSRGLPSTKSSDGERKNTKWKIRNAEATLPKETEESRLFDIIDGEKLKQRINESAGTSNDDGKTNSGEISNSEWSNGRIENARPTQMGTANEQLQIDSRGTDYEGTNIHIEENSTETMQDDLLTENENIAKELPTEKEQKQKIAEVENTSVFDFTQEMIDSVLKEGSHIENSKFRIYEYLIRGLPSKDNAEFLKNEYGDGGRSADYNGISEDHNAKGIRLYSGYEENRPEILLTWKQVEKRIRELISSGRYFNQQEEDEYYDWLDANGIANNNIEEQIKDEDYELAERLHSYILNYDSIVYNNNFPLDTTTEQNIELIQADIKDGSNIKHYIDLLKGSYEDLDYDDEMSIQARSIIVELERRLPYFELENGDIVYIGTEEYEIRTIDDERVVLVDTSFPLLTKEMTREEFNKKLKENPANDKVRTGKRVQGKQVASEIQENEEEKQADTTTETIIKQNEQEESKEETTFKANIKRKRRNKIEYFDLHPEIPMGNRNNYKIQDNDLGVGTKREKYQNNIDAIKVLKLCEEENRFATPEEQEVLSKYVGWGGLQEAFDSRNDSWSKEYKELNSLLTEKEYAEAKRSTLTAFYTPPIVIKSIYKALENMGLERGNILEPSCRNWKFYRNVTRYIK